MRSEAEVRHERFLWGEVAYPAPVIAVFGVEHPSQVQAALDEQVARCDDAFWLAYTRLPFTWQRFLNWWAARRWVVPRDIRKE